MIFAKIENSYNKYKSYNKKGRLAATFPDMLSFFSLLFTFP